MFQAGTSKLLTELSIVTMAAGRSMKSPKRDVIDLLVLAETLELAAQCLRNLVSHETALSSKK